MKTKTTHLGLAIAGLLVASSAGAWTTITPTAFTTSGVETALGTAASKTSYGDPAFGGQAWAMTGRWGTFNAVKGRKVTITIDATTSPGFHPGLTVWKRPVGTVDSPYKGITNLTEAKYVPDHNFTPTQSYIESAASQNHVLGSGGGSCTDSGSVTCATATKTINGTSVTAKVVDFWGAAKRTAVTAADQVMLEDGSTLIGFPRMLHVKSVWDADKANVINNKLNIDPNLTITRDGVAGKVTLSFIPNETCQYEFFTGGWNPDTSSVVNTILKATVTGI